MSQDDPETKPKSYYRPIPGSRELITGGEGESAELKALEQAAAGPDGLPPRLRVEGEWLGGARVEAGSAALPLAVWDRLALTQTPLEQAVYQQLARLAYGQGRNYCWAGKRELERRCRLSERRLHVALDGLIEKGHARPLARRNRGTLYRVFLPAEVLDQAEEPGVRLGEKREAGMRAGAGRAVKGSPVAGKDLDKIVDTTFNAESKQGALSPPAPGLAAPAATRPEKLRARPLESPLNEERFADVGRAAGPTVSVAEIAAGFFRASGVKPAAEELDAALAEITALLEDGFAREEVHRAAAWYGRKFKKTRKLDRLAYYIHQALAGEE